MSSIYENPIIDPAENPQYLDYWTSFAEEQISRHDSPIKQGEEDRFRQRCLDNSLQLAEATNVMHENPTIDNVYEWYSRLGSTSELEGAKDDLVKARSYIVKSGEIDTQPDRALMLFGNLAHESALLSDGEEADGLFAIAKGAYGKIISMHHDDLSNREVRQAYAHLFNATFASLTYAKRDGLVDQTEFDRIYMQRHKELVFKIEQLTAESANTGDGELYEWYGELLLRHMLWSSEQFGDIEVRRAFTPREDRPHDGFRLGGRHVNQSGSLPSYAFDIKLTNHVNEEEPWLIQLKAGEDNGRYAVPPLKVMKYTENEPLRKHVSRIIKIMKKSYEFDTTLEQEAELSSEIEHQILQAA